MLVISYQRNYSMSKVRIINDKTGEVKWVSSYVAEQTKQLATYGFRVEDPKVTFAFEPLNKEVKEPENTDETEVVNEGNDSGMELEFDAVEPVIERKKPGRKPKEVTE